MEGYVRGGGGGRWEGMGGWGFVCWLVAQRPSNKLVYLRDGWVGGGGWGGRGEKVFEYVSVYVCVNV